MNRRVLRLEREYEEERLMIDSVRSLSDNDGMPHGNGISKPTEERAVRIADTHERLLSARAEAVEVRQRVFDVIDQVKDIEGDALYLRYIELQKWNAVASSLGYSVPGIYNIRTRALEKVEKIINGVDK